MTDVSAADFEKAGSMNELLSLLEKTGIENGWAKLEPSLYAQPKKHYEAAHWRFDLARAALDAAGRFVNTELAERRNLILNNPVPGNHYPTVTTLVAAYQMVKSGEVARSHRHTPNALRLVLDAKPGMYTVVNGEKIPMLPNDVLLTPNWSWHGHDNQSSASAIWIDVLDVPLVHLLGPMFFEHHPDGIEPSHTVAIESPNRFPFAQTIEGLAAAPELSPGCRRIELGNPAMRTIALHVVRLDPGVSYEAPATTLNAVHAVMQGDGLAQVEDRTFDFTRGDVIAVPSSCAQRWTARDECYILRASDQPLLQFLDWLRPVGAGP